MTIPFYKTRLLLSCLAVSILLHLLTIYSMRIFATYDFTTPVNLSQRIEVELANPASQISPQKPAESLDSQKESTAGGKSPVKRTHETSTEPSNQERLPSEPKTDPSPENNVESPDSHDKKNEAIADNSSGKDHQPAAAAINPSPLGTVGAFLSDKNEKLTYQISMFGLPVGSAELEARQEKGEIWLTLRVKSSSVVSGIYQINNTVETRHISGRFIMTKIMQQEGTFRSDQGITINLNKKRVTWSDNIGGRSQTINVPTDEVIDTLSGIYLLRSRQLQIGIAETLHIFDSEIYADVPVEVLRRETVRLANFTKIDTLVVRPLQKTAGIFRRTGDILIWLTDDADKVPVRIVTSVALGTVTAELVSAESKYQEGGGPTSMFQLPTESARREAPL